LTWAGTVAASDLYTSVLVIGEIRSGIERLRVRDTRQADALEAWLDQLKIDFAERLIGVSPAVAERWGRLNAVRPLPVVDGLLAATAIEHDLTLVTRDAAAVERTGVPVVDPWGS
jgi:hypothetical protein